jgi:ankyrin repeat protein
VNAKESAKGQDALMWAAAENNAAAVQALIDAGADVRARSRPSPDLTNTEPGDRGFTAFLFAARGGHIDAARALLAAGADVNDKVSDGTSALLLAVISGRLDMAAFLLDRGADPNASEQGWTALHHITYTRRPNRGGNTMGPAVRGQTDTLSLVKKLVARGADVNARMTKAPVEIYVGRQKLNLSGATPFLLAANRVDVELMRLLVELGADTLLSNEEGTTPLMAAAGVGLWFPGESPGTPEDAAAAVAFCLQLGADPTTVDANGDTALHGAAYWDSPGAVQALVAAGAQLDAKNKRGWTPLRIADGVTITASIHVSPAAADLLRRLMRERGLPVPDRALDDGR